LLIVFAVRRNLAFQRTAVHLEGHRLRQVALGHGADHARGLGGRVDEVVDQLVHVGDLVAPEAARVAHLARELELAFLADPSGAAARAPR
jgi:hypothetical protein